MHNSDKCYAQADVDFKASNCHKSRLCYGKVLPQQHYPEPLSMVLRG